MAAAEGLVQEAPAGQGVVVRVTPLHPLEAPEILLQHLHHKVAPVVPVPVPPRRLNTLAAAVGRVLSVGMQT